MFSWRQNSEQIFNKILSSHSVDDSEDESDSDTDDDLTTSFSVLDSPTTPTRKQHGQWYDEEIERKLKLWTDLTNIRMGPFANPDRMKLAQAKMHRQTCFRSFSEGYSTGPTSRISDAENTLTIKFQYLIISERLKVTVSKANNLTMLARIDKDTELHARVGLFPSKWHHKDTCVVKGCRNPEFNSVIYFHGISLQEMHQKSLKLTLYCKGGEKRRFEGIGEVTVSLENFDLTSETTLNEPIETRIRHVRGGSSRLSRRQEASVKF